MTFKEGAAVTVILAAQGYPGTYEKGKKITFGDLPSGVWSFSPLHFELLLKYTRCYNFSCWY